MPFGIDNKDVELIVEVLKSNNKVSIAILFGSRALGSFEPGSDVDIAVNGAEIKLNDIIDLKISLDDLSLPFKFDIINLNRISEPALLDHINRVGIDLFKENYA